MKPWHRRLLGGALSILGALLSGFVVAGTALAMTGGGDGWNSAFVSAAAVLTTPGAAVAWLLRRSRPGPPLAAAVVLVNLGSVALLIHDTRVEGWHDAGRVIHAVPGLFAVWLTLWAGWQGLALLALASSIRARSAR